MKVLLVDDDTKLTEVLTRGLGAEGFGVDVSHDGDDGWWKATEGTHDVIVLDIMMPKRNGFVLCADLRRAGIWTPILMLTAKTGEYDEAEALDTGADDFLCKPFSYTVLVARLRALARRADMRVPVPSSVGDLRLDPATRGVWRGDTPVELTAREFDVLEFLVRRAGAVVSKNDILAGVWSHDFEGDNNIVEVFIRRLRRKLDEPFGRSSLVTARGAGYRLDADG